MYKPTSSKSNVVPQTILVASSAPSMKLVTASRRDATAKANRDALLRVLSMRLPSAGMRLNRSAAMASKNTSTVGDFCWSSSEDIPRCLGHSLATESTTPRKMGRDVAVPPPSTASISTPGMLYGAAMYPDMLCDGWRVRWYSVYSWERKGGVIRCGEFRR